MAEIDPEHFRGFKFLSLRSVELAKMSDVSDDFEEDEAVQLGVCMLFTY